MIKKLKKIFAGIIPNWIMDILSAYQLRKNPYYQRIENLQIIRSGLSDDHIPFVELLNGRVFYGYLPTAPQIAYYKHFLDKQIKKKLNKECINVAFDIAVRYLGPESQTDFLNHGKFYGFRKGDTVVEVGAYIGYYVMRVAELVGEGGRVVAIEAVEENLQLLRKNIEANGFKHVIIVPKAAWNSEGSLRFYRNTRQQASAMSTVVNAQEEFDVHCDSIDNILKNADIAKVDFIRIQVNGVEREVLLGMPELLKQNPTLLVAAIYERDGKKSWMEIKTTLESYGYTTQIGMGNILAVKTG